MVQVTNKLNKACAAPSCCRAFQRDSDELESTKINESTFCGYIKIMFQNFLLCSYFIKKHFFIIFRKEKKTQLNLVWYSVNSFCNKDQKRKNHDAYSYSFTLNLITCVNFYLHNLHPIILVVACINLDSLIDKILRDSNSYSTRAQYRLKRIHKYVMPACT
ncbi:hypothetical protein BpHYR1_035071 [Brachionus plicatilis]|uniref:Uncharacterized protein n=1 Tax=Brachionus plicatilis TaxID=10195 RepID=A0A3M7SZQ5_BRAPC|nr:hypothetical protein BpHYR1_035071 [Brachionus plicatilis]